AVDVDAERVPVLRVGEHPNVGLARQHTRVETGEVDGTDRAPRSRIGDVEPVYEVELRDLVAFGLEPRDERPPDAARRAGDERLHGSRTTLPQCRRSSISAWAADASSSGKVAPITGSISPRAQSESSSSAHSRTKPGWCFMRRPR